MIRDKLDREMMAWFAEIKPAPAANGIPPAPLRVEVSTVTFRREEPLPPPPKEIVMLGTTNSNTNSNNGNV